MENVHPNRSLSWDFTEKDDIDDDEPVSEVMEFFEMAASLIRTLAPDSTAPRTIGTSASTPSS